MSQIDWESKFPDMKPLRSVPWLGSVNGIGTLVYGRRDFDEETYSYVKTRVFCLVFLPVFALGAYRVVDAAQGGWYFLGKVPLSALARAWNFLVLVALLGVAGWFGWESYTGSVEYQAGRKLAEADKLAGEGKVGQAARLCREVAEGTSSLAEKAPAKLGHYLASTAGRATPEEAGEAYRIAVDLYLDRGGLNPYPLGMKLGGDLGVNNPRFGLAVFEAIAPVAPDPKKHAALLQPLLEKLVAAEPEDVDLAGRLAAAYQSQNQLDKCEQLLTPLLPKLGQSEGARVLGQIYVAKGQFDKAHALLQPYAEAKLKKLHEAEQAYEAATKSCLERVKGELQSGKAPGFDFARHQGADRDAQGEMLRQFVDGRLRGDAEVTRAQKELLRQSGAVPVAIDFGIVLLRRAQDMQGPRRQEELKKAKDTFLAIKGLAGQSDEYRLFLGQVHCWLGEFKEGQKLFDDMVEARGRDPQVLLKVGTTLREVGLVSDARKLAEEAHAKAQDPQTKYRAAMVRGVLWTDDEDEIAWLRRCNPADPEAKASLARALGNKAHKEGKVEEAADQLRQAGRLYREMPENPTTLNNGSFVYLSLYRLTGDRKEVDQALKMQEKAVALLPADTILLQNFADSVLEAALADTLADKIDFKTLKTSATWGLFPYLYQDQAGRDRYAGQVKDHPGVARALALYDRVLVLAPKNPRVYGSLLALHGFTRNLDALRDLAKRVQEVGVERADTDKELLAYFKGENQEKFRSSMKAGVQFAEKALQAARQGPPGLTFAVAAASLVKAQTGADAVGLPIDPDGAVKLAEEAHRAAPSSGTLSNLLGALLTRAHRTLIKQDAGYAALAKKAERSLGARYLLCVAVSHEDNATCKVCLANPDVRRVLGLSKESAAKFPGEFSEWHWALFRYADPAEAARIAESLGKNELLRLDRTVSLGLSALNTADVFDAYWVHLAAGREDEGRAVLRRAAGRGLPLPFEP